MLPMQRQGSEWMRSLLMMTLALSVAGCASAVSEAAICSGTATARAEHAAALAVDGGDRSVVTGARLVKLLDAGCGK